MASRDFIYWIGVKKNKSLPRVCAKVTNTRQTNRANLALTDPNDKFNQTRRSFVNPIIIISLVLAFNSFVLFGR